jgi:hypothetical protein
MAEAAAAAPAGDTAASPPSWAWASSCRCVPPSPPLFVLNSASHYFSLVSASTVARPAHDTAFPAAGAEIVALLFVAVLAIWYRSPARSSSRRRVSTSGTKCKKSSVPFLGFFLCTQPGHCSFLSSSISCNLTCSGPIYILHFLSAPTHNAAHDSPTLMRSYLDGIPMPVATRNSATRRHGVSWCPCFKHTPLTNRLGYQRGGDTSLSPRSLRV